jgi:hypothetical protein
VDRWEAPRRHFGAMGLSLPLTQALTELMTAQFEAGEHGA